MACSNTQRAGIAAFVAIACVVAPAADAASAQLDCTLRFSVGRFTLKQI